MYRFLVLEAGMLKIEGLLALRFQKSRFAEDKRAKEGRMGGT
jgi:hypothetical protein